MIFKYFCSLPFLLYSVVDNATKANKINISSCTNLPLEMELCAILSGFRLLLLPLKDLLN